MMHVRLVGLISEAPSAIGKPKHQAWRDGAMRSAFAPYTVRSRRRFVETLHYILAQSTRVLSMVTNTTWRADRIDRRNDPAVLGATQPGDSIKAL